MADEAIPSAAESFTDDVWHAELDALTELRRRRGGGDPGELPAADGVPARERAQRGGLTGLTFSGGGIRSATFNLGIAQGLARLGLLRRFDYLSTVSGGGYVGSWLTAWIRRAGFDAVEEELPCEHDPESDQGNAADRERCSPVTFLRSFSNYLTPRVGLFSADTWAAVATYLRNLLLNLTVVVAALAAILLLPRLAVLVARLFDGSPFGSGTGLLASLSCLLLAIFFMGANVIEIEAFRARHRPWFTCQGWIQVVVAVPLFLGAALASVAFWHLDVAGRPEGSAWNRPLVWVGANAVTYFFFWFLTWIYLKLRAEHHADHEPSTRWAILLATGPVAGGVGGALAWLLVETFATLNQRLFPDGAGELPSLIHATTWGAPAIVLVFILVAVLHIGLMGRDFDEANREWWSRLGGWLLIYGITWLAFMSMAFYVPILVIWLGGLAASALGAGWLGSSIGGVLFERRASGSEGEPSPLRSVVRALTPQIFVIGLLALLSLGLHAVLDAPRASPGEEFWPEESKLVPLTRDHLRWTAESLDVPADLGFVSVSRTPFLVVVLALVALGLSWRVDINLFSMHFFYRNRLIRAYLGASNKKRYPQPFTGFDPRDDIPLSSLQPGAGSYDGPYHLINANLNLVGGQELAWQERKGSSFLFSPLYTGFVPHDPQLGGRGFRPTDGYRSGGISLGMAMAVSGAAVSPSMGAGTTPAMAFLLTVFDARLGWWLGNPLKSTWRRLGPDVGLFRLLAELFGTTDDQARYVYLSDGGHFENLGIYELVRRQTRLVVCCDGSADPERVFGALGNAARKCRADFGVPIDLQLQRFRFGAPEERSEVHCAVGTIRYDAVDPEAENGTLVYLKATLTDDEPADVLNYAASNETFPNQSTADQFFDEAQFESYRALGYHTAMEVFGQLDRLRELDRDELCEALRETW